MCSLIGRRVHLSIQDSPEAGKGVWRGAEGVIATDEGVLVSRNVISVLGGFERSDQ